jgi:predicted metal-dependent phosphoesterase TrpH
MIDLHAHTSESDGTLSPGELLAEAGRVGLEALAITDHDTFSGYDQAASGYDQTGYDEAAGMDSVGRALCFSGELICGIELSTSYLGRTVHLLAYFLNLAPTDQFRDWVNTLGGTRHKRNLALARELCARGIHVTLEEVAARGGRVVTRPHFAALMVEKGYVSSVRQAFDQYLDESGACFVPREDPEFKAAIERILAAGGLPVLPHPGRVGAIRNHPERELTEMRNLGLRGVEVYHSDHSPSDVALYSTLASKLGLAATGGSDFHGAAKPEVALGTGVEGNVNVPRSVLDELRRIARL